MADTKTAKYDAEWWQVGTEKPPLSQCPYPHFVVPGFLPSAEGRRLLDWLEKDAKWGFRSINDFYETYDLDLRHFDLPASLSFLTEMRFHEWLRSYFGSAFNCGLDSWVDVTAQKMVTGQKIKLHTDYGEYGQSHRLLIQINRGWTIECGGLLMLFDEEFPTEVTNRHRYYNPEHCAGIGFEISPTSYHAVSQVLSGTRYTLCFSFRELRTTPTDAPRIK